MSAKKSAVLVLGAPRSGTSVLSHVLSGLGFDFGESSHFVDVQTHPWNPVFFELRSLNALNDQIIRSQGHEYLDFDWLPLKAEFEDEAIRRFEAQARELLQTEFPRGGDIGLKDPRLCFTLPFWLSVLTKTGYTVRLVWAIRELSACLASNRKLVGDVAPKRPERLVVTSTLAAAYMLEGADYFVADYDRLVSDSAELISSLSDWLGLASPNIDAACSVVDAALRHVAAEAQADEAPLLADLSERLMAGALGAQEYLQLRDILTSYGFEGLLRERRSQLEAQQQLRIDDSARLEALTAELSNKERTVSELVREANARDERLSQLTAHLSDKQEAISRVTDALKASEERQLKKDSDAVRDARLISELNQALSEQRGKTLTLHATVSQQGEAIRELKEALARINAENENLKSAEAADANTKAELKRALAAYAERERELTAGLEAQAALAGQLQATIEAHAQREAELTEDLEVQAAHASELRTTIEAYVRREHLLTEDLEVQAAHASELQAMIEAYARRERELTEDLEVQAAHAGELRATIEAQARRTHELEAAVTAKDALTAHILGSRCWRVTAPLRGVGNVVKRLAGPIRWGGQALQSVPAGAQDLAVPARGTLRGAAVSFGYDFYRRYMKRSRLGRRIGHQILKRGLVSAAELNSCVLAAAPDAARPCEPAQQEAAPPQLEQFVPGFHLSPPLNLEISPLRAVRPCINVLLPSLRTKHMSGGPNTALLLASLLAEQGEYVRLIACDAPADGREAELLPHMDALLRRPVPRDRIELVDAFDRSRSTAIGANDIFLATAWWTAQMAKHAVAKTAAKTFIYLIQDFEPILHEGSTFQARALETYALSHIPVINTKLLLDYLVQQRAGRYADAAFAGNALWFEPALDRSRYFPDRGHDPGHGKKVLLFYARPTVARRNLFEIGVVALRHAVATGAIDAENWEVWAMGENLAPVALGKGVFLNPLPWMSFDAYAERVRTANLLLSLMLSPHPSYPPLEMAASGKLVVTNSFGVKTLERMREFSPNIIVAEPTAESIGEALIGAAGRINAGMGSYDPGGSVPLPGDWDQSLGPLVPALLERVRALRSAPPMAGAVVAPGLPVNPQSNYEHYRRACLKRRRQDGEYHQTDGLLSFITSAYDTDPQFLRELGACMFLQDGGMNFEWLILDNGSTRADTREALMELGAHAGVRLERVENNLGIIGGMRYLLERASGRYVLPLDSDDLIDPDCVHVLTRFIEDNGYPALLYTDEDKVNEGRFGTPYFKPDWDPVLFVHSCYIAHLCAIDRVKALELGLYSSGHAEGCHDWDSFIRFMSAGHVPRHVPEVLYAWRIHNESTSGNIGSKSYISESHRNTLQRFLDSSGTSDIELVNSPLFDYNVDWWFRRKRSNPQSVREIVVAVDGVAQAPVCFGGDSTQAPLVLSAQDGVSGLARLLGTMDAELIHLCWDGVTVEGDDWAWDAMALLELFGDTVAVGGILHDGKRILDGPRVFGFGDGYDCPDRGRALEDPGYGAKLWKPHTASAIPAAHCVVRRSFLAECMAELTGANVHLSMLGPWLGALAAERGKRVVHSPFVRARAPKIPYEPVASQDQACFLSRFWALLPDTRVYSPRLGLAQDNSYKAVPPEANQAHRLALQTHLLPYREWLDMRSRRRLALYPASPEAPRLSLITTIYERTSLALLDVLAESVIDQSVRPAQWVIVAHGPIKSADLSHIQQSCREHWGATLLVSEEPLGIAGAMRRGLEAATGDYIVPVDADDVLMTDAIQVLACALERGGRPDVVYSDEDLLIADEPSSPYLRSEFDPVLNLDSSYIWHLCAINRERALSLGLYTDPGATWCHDWDSVMRLANAGCSIQHVPEVLYHWRQHSGSTTNNVSGESPSLQSVRHVLEGQIARSPNPDLFHVAAWPEDRGASELYIARIADDLPQFVWYGDFVACESADGDDDAVIVVAADGILIDSQRVFVEVARLLDLHPRVGAVGGLVTTSDGIVVDACSLVNRGGEIESPWLGRSAGFAGPYALALKPQTVAAAGTALAFFRLGALRHAGVWPLPHGGLSEASVTMLSDRVAAKGWAIAFSPLVKARAGSSYSAKPTGVRARAAVHAVGGALARYGLERDFGE